MAACGLCLKPLTHARVLTGTVITTHASMLYTVLLRADMANP
jgi:hypothetical protein